MEPGSHRARPGQQRAVTGRSWQVQNTPTRTRRRAAALCSGLVRRELDLHSRRLHLRRWRDPCDAGGGAELVRPRAAGARQAGGGGGSSRVKEPYRAGTSR